jgi:outer membrane protein assembly factor BamE (lipoprotein component of BamABCDE complex)
MGSVTGIIFRSLQEKEMTMRSSIEKIFTVIAIIVLAGCAGKDFVRPDSGALKNGQTTYNQIVQQFGKPYAEGSVLKNDKFVKTVSYAYASVGGKSYRGGTAARAMGFYFVDDTLVGYEFVSSFAEDNTDFDEMKINQITEGKTTLDQAIQILGKPAGYYTYPLIESDTEEAAVYVYSETKGSAFNMKMFRKMLAITYDSSRVVTKMEYTSFGSN